MATDVQNRRAVEATQEARTLPSGVLDVNTTDDRLSIHNSSTVGGVPHVNWEDAVNQEFVYASGTGTNAITASLVKAPSAYQTGQRFSIKIGSNNTGSSTLNIDSLGAKTIKKQSGGSLVDLEEDDLVANTIRDFFYNGTYMVLDGGAGGGGAWEIIDSQVISVSTDTIEFTGLDRSTYREILMELDVYFSDDSTQSEIYMGFGNGSYTETGRIFLFPSGGLSTVYYSVKASWKMHNFRSDGSAGKVKFSADILDFSSDFTDTSFANIYDYDDIIERVKIKMDDISGGENFPYARAVLYGLKTPLSDV